MAGVKSAHNGCIRLHGLVKAQSRTDGDFEIIHFQSPRFSTGFSTALIFMHKLKVNTVGAAAKFRIHFPAAISVQGAAASARLRAAPTEILFFKRHLADFYCAATAGWLIRLQNATRAHPVHSLPDDLAPLIFRSTGFFSHKPLFFKGSREIPDIPGYSRIFPVTAI